MFSIQPSMYQKYQQNKDTVVDFVPFLVKKEKAQAVIKELAYTVFERFGCGVFFDESCIKNLDGMYEAANFNIELLNFNPKNSIFSFLETVHAADFLKISNQCKFYTGLSSEISRIDINYQFLVRRNSEFIKSKVAVVYDGNFEIEHINYQRINDQREVTINIDKNNDMLCSVENETLFLELFLNDNNSELKELFPAFFEHGPHVLNADEIESNSMLAKTLLI